MAKKRGRKWTKKELTQLQREHWGSVKPPKDKKPKRRSRVRGRADHV